MRNPLRTGLAAAVALAVVPLALAAPAPHAATAGATAAAAPQTYPTTQHAYPKARAHRVVERRVLGRSTQGRTILAYRKGNPAARHTVLVLGQMHGDEPAGRVTARTLWQELPVDSDADVWIVPTMNPDGSALGTRRNSRGVDLNRNWPTSGWVSGSRSSSTYGGPRAASEPETRAMMRFLDEVRPELITSLHQPFGSIGRNDKTPRYVRRLARNLDLPVEDIGVGTPSDRVAPTLTSWYNARHAGGAVTVELTARPSRWYQTVKAPRGILRANLAAW